MKTPTVDDLHTAAQWLDIYQDAEDRDACQRVRQWLLQKADDIQRRTKKRAPLAAQAISDGGRQA